MATASSRWQALRSWVAPYLGLVAVHLLAGANGYYPTIHPDEVIYREIARYFASVGPVPNLGDTFVFPVGYPLLISPLFRWFEDLESLGFALLLFNSLLASTVFFPVAAFLRGILGVPRHHAVLAALAVGVYPAYLVIAGMALTQHAFVPVYAALVVLAGRVYRRPGVVPAALLGAAAAALYAVHERALLVMAVAVVQLAFLALIGHLRWRVAAAGAAVAAVGLAAVRLLAAQVHDAVYRGGGASRPLSEVLSKLLHTEGWLDFGLQIAGQAWYLLVATYGLFGIGVAWLVKLVWTRRSELWRSGPATAGSHCVLFLLTTSGAIFTTCAIYFPSNPIMRPSSEFYFFGRINEGFLALVMAAGLAALWPDRPRGSVKADAAVPISMAVTFAMGVIMVAGRGMEVLAENPRTYGVFGVRWFLRDNTWLIHPVLGTLLLATAWISLYWILRHRSRLLHGVVALSFLIVAADLSIHYFGRRQQRQHRRSLPPLIAAAGGIDTVAIDTRGLRAGRWADLVRRVEVVNFSSARGETPPAPLVLTRREWDGAERHGARFLAADRDAGYALWVLPGGEQERLWRPPDYRSVAFGAQSIWAVWERGFSERELWHGPEPMRWTGGRRAYLEIPLAGRPPPVLLHVDVAAAAREYTELDLKVNGRELIEVDVPRGGWSGTLDLDGVEVGDVLRLRIKSDYSTHPARLYGSPRPYDRGVLVRGIYLLDAEEAAALAAPPEQGPLRYRLTLAGSGEGLEAAPEAPLVLVLRIENTGSHLWPGALGGEGRQSPRLVAGWYPAAGGPPAATVEVEVRRPLLPGRELRLPVALAPRDGDGGPLPPGAYQLRATLALSPRDPSAPAGGEPLVLPVTVRAAAPKFFAPVRVLAWRVRPSQPPFTLTPF